jgi:hypothetical protein
MQLSNFFNCNIALQTNALQTQSTDTINFLSHEANFPERSRSYGSAADAVADLVGGANSLTYAMIAASKSKSIIITNVGSRKAVIFSDDTGSAYSITVNGKVYSASTYLAMKTLVDADYVLTDIAGTTAVGFIIDPVSTDPLLNISDVSCTGVTGSVAQFGYLLHNAGTMTSGLIKYSIDKVEHTVPFHTSQATTLSDLAASILANTTKLIACAVDAATDSNRIYWVADVNKTVDIEIVSVVKGASDTLEICEGYYWDGATMGEDISLALADTMKFDGNFFYLLSCGGGSSHTGVVANRKAIADWNETTDSYFFAGLTMEQAAYNTAAASDSTSFLYYCKNKTYLNTWALCTKQFNRDHLADAVVIGSIARAKPGSYDLFGYPMSGISADHFTVAQETNIRAKFGDCASYFKINQTGEEETITICGKTGYGEWVETCIGRLWMKMLIPATCYSNKIALSKANQKVPLTLAGLAQLEGWIANACSQGLPSTGYPGFLTPLEKDDSENVVGGYAIVMPDISAMTPSEKALGEITVQVILYASNAIKLATINGIITY